MSQDNNTPNNVKQLAPKGFRQAPKPTKGEVAQENRSLAQVLQNQIKQMQQFYGNMLSQVMGQTRNMNQEIGQLTIWLASGKVEDGAQLKDNLLLDYAGVLLKDDGSFDTLTMTDAEGNAKEVPNFFDGGSGDMFILTSLGGGTLVPGFEEALVGLKAGEGKEIVLKFPETYSVEAFKGKPAKFFVYIHEVRRPYPVSPIGGLVQESNRIKAELQAKAIAKSREAEEAKKAQAELAQVEAEEKIPADKILEAQVVAQSEDQAAAQATPEQAASLEQATVVAEYETTNEPKQE